MTFCGRHPFSGNIIHQVKTKNKIHFRSFWLILDSSSIHAGISRIFSNQDKRHKPLKHLSGQKPITTVTTSFWRLIFSERECEKYAVITKQRAMLRSLWYLEKQQWTDFSTYFCVWRLWGVQQWLSSLHTDRQLSERLRHFHRDVRGVSAASSSPPLQTQ